MEKYIFDQSNGLWYELQGDYYIPCLVLDEASTSPIGMWGRKHQQYLKEHRPILYSDLVLSGVLHSYLADCKCQRKSEPGAHEKVSHKRPRKSEPERSRIVDPVC